MLNLLCGLVDFSRSWLCYAVLLSSRARLSLSSASIFGNPTKNSAPGSRFTREHRDLRTAVQRSKCRIDPGCLVQGVECFENCTGLLGQPPRPRVGSIFLEPCRPSQHRPAETVTRPDVFKNPHRCLDIIIGGHRCLSGETLAHQPARPALELEITLIAACVEQVFDRWSRRW